MGVIYSGQTITDTVLDGSGVAALNQAIKDCLINVGWSLQKDGSGDGIWRVRCAATPQALQGDLWLWSSTGQTPVAELAASSILATTNATTGYQEQNPIGLSVGAGITYRIIAGAYYFYLYRDVQPMTTDCFCFCVPYIPPNLVGMISSAVMGWGGSAYSTALSSLGSGGLFNGAASGYNAPIFSYLNGQGYSDSKAWYIYSISSYNKPVWFDASCEYYEPRVVAYSSVNGSRTGTPHAVGYLWDALVVNQPIPRGTTIAYDGGTWFVMTEGVDPGLMVKIA